MLTRIQIDGLRGISDADIDGLAPVTLLVGPNGCGKSTVLEAIGVACAGRSAADAFLALAQREWLGLDGIQFWFMGPERTASVAIWENSDAPVAQTAVGATTTLDMDLANAARMNGEQGELRALTLARPFEALINKDGAITGAISGDAFRPFTLETAFVDRPAGASRRYAQETFSSAHREALSKVKLTPYYDDFIAYLREIRPNIDSIESLAVGDRDEPHVIEKDPRHGYPLAYAGDGFRRMLKLAAAFARTKGGVVAIDEPEAFAHPGLYGSLAKLLRRANGDGTQVFMATHSLEFIKAVLCEFEKDPEVVAVVGLSNDRGHLDPVVITGPNAYRRVVDLGHDLRL
jgi:energy-coupling factor transporter ATP-binding protein EcfA2